MIKKLLIFIVLFLLISLTIAFWFRKPLLTGDWDKDVSVLAVVKFQNNKSKVILSGIRNWSYNSAGPIDDSIYFDQLYDIADLEKAWFYVQPLEASGLAAHTFIVFEFSEKYGSAKNLGISIETRRRKGQEYSLLKGALRSFVITHTWATESDLTSRRTDYLDYDLYKYQLKLSKPEIQSIFLAFLTETQKLHSEPRFYNTITNNCTNALAEYINKSSGKEIIPWHYSFILTGKSAQYLKKLGYIN